MESKMMSQEQPYVDQSLLHYSFIQHFPKDSQYRCNVGLRTNRGGLQIAQYIHNHRGNHLVNQTKFWFTMGEDRSFFARIKRDQIKVQFDNGYSDILGKPINFYGSLHFKRPLNNVSWRAGAYYKDKTLSIDSRLKIQSSPDKSKYHMFWHTKASKMISKLSMGTVLSVDLINRFITRNYVYLGYAVNQNTSVFLRGENEQYRIDPIKITQWGHYFDSLFVDVISRIDDKTKIGLEGVVEMKSRPVKQLRLVLERKVSENIWMKGKIDSRCDFNFMMKGWLLNNSDYLFSIGVHGVNVLSKERSFNNGVRLDLNI